MICWQLLDLFLQVLADIYAMASCKKTHIIDGPACKYLKSSQIRTL